MRRSVKLVPEKTGDEDFFPKTFQQDAMKGEEGAFRCLCDSTAGTVTFVTRGAYLEEKKSWIAQIAKKTSFEIQEDDWKEIQPFFKDLVKVKTEPGQYGDFKFYTTPNMQDLLEALRDCASEMRCERKNDLHIWFYATTNPSKKTVDVFLNKYPQCKTRISYMLDDKDKSSVERITLKSRANDLLDTVKTSGKLTLTATDIFKDGENEEIGLNGVLERAVEENLKELTVPKEASEEGKKEVFLEAVKKMLSEMAKNDWSPFNVTGDADVVKMLLETYGNDGKRKYFFIPSEDGSKTRCSVTNRKAFYAKRLEALLEKIKNTASETDILGVSSLDVNRDSILRLCYELRKSNSKGNLSVTGFGKETAQNIIANLVHGDIERSWSLEFKNCPNEPGVSPFKDMEKGFALPVSPDEKKDMLKVKFYPAGAKEELFKDVLAIFKDKFKETDGSCKVSHAYWGLDTAAVLKAADDPNSKVTELVFTVGKNVEKASKALLSGIETFCKEEPIHRAG